MSDQDGGGVGQDETDFETYQEKMDELNEGLLKAYAAGFAKAKEVYNIESGPTDFRELMETEGVAESHYYFWDGRSKPLVFWLEEQFGFGPEVEDDGE